MVSLIISSLYVWIFVNLSLSGYYGYLSLCISNWHNMWILWCYSCNYFFLYIYGYSNVIFVTVSLCISICMDIIMLFCLFEYWDNNNLFVYPIIFLLICLFNTGLVLLTLFICICVSLYQQIMILYVSLLWYPFSGCYYTSLVMILY